jgi:hypothetical protein
MCRTTSGALAPQYWQVNLSRLKNLETEGFRYGATGGHRFYAVAIEAMVRIAIAAPRDRRSHRTGKKASRG